MKIIPPLRQEIVTFVHKALENEHSKNDIERNLNILTHDLREKLIFSAYSNNFLNVKILTKNFSNEFIEKLLLKVKILQKKPKETIFEVISINIYKYI